MMQTRDKKRGEIEPRGGFDFIDRFFDDWPALLRRPVMLWPDRLVDSFRVEEFQDDGTFVVKAEIPGLDPEKDVEVAVHNGVLEIDAERREEDKSEGRNYVRREIRYGSLHREVPLPEGASDGDVEATYKNGLLEIRVPVKESTPKKSIPVRTE